jgi:hypothetical protein
LNNLSASSAAGNLLVQDAAGSSTVTFSASNPFDWWGTVGLSLEAVSGPSSSLRYWNGSTWVTTPVAELWTGSAPPSLTRCCSTFPVRSVTFAGALQCTLLVLMWTGGVGAPQAKAGLELLN